MAVTIGAGGGETVDACEGFPALKSGDEPRTHLLRASLNVRSEQGVRSAPAVLVAAAIVLAALWDSTDQFRLLAWLSLVCGAIIIAYFVCRDILAEVDAASSDELQRYHWQMIFMTVLNSISVGAVFWWLGGDGASDQTIFTITLIACLYCIGAMVNLSVDAQNFPFGIVLNLGQGILFFSGVGGEFRPEVAVSVAAVAFLLFGFGRVNARQFSESIRIRSENVALVAQLDAEKRVVEQALAAAQEANTAKSRFLAAASHDLRQPLHALGLFLGSLSLMVEGEEARKLLRRIRETADVLNGHFNSLLDLSRFDAGGVEVECSDFNLCTLLKSAVEEFRPQAEAKGLALSVSTETWRVHSDEVLIERVVRNLLSNAVRYTAKGAVSVVTECVGARVMVAVVDSGPGIPEAEQPKIFDEFVQLNNPARRREHGVGLGLAIVKRIDTLLGLRLRLRSTVGLGSRFEFELPLAGGKPQGIFNMPSEVNSAISPFPVPTGGLRVWVVEDDAAVAEALCMQLRAWGCVVVLATTREELQAQYSATGCWPDLVLVDDMLDAGESGLEIAGWLSSYVPQQHVVMVTGNTSPDRLSKIASNGFPLILKPMSPQRLMEVLGSVI